MRCKYSQPKSKLTRNSISCFWVIFWKKKITHSCRRDVPGYSVSGSMDGWAYVFHANQNWGSINNQWNCRLYASFNFVSIFVSDSRGDHLCFRINLHDISISSTRCLCSCRVELCVWTLNGKVFRNFHGGEEGMRMWNFTCRRACILRAVCFGGFALRDCFLIAVSCE